MITRALPDEHADAVASAIPVRPAGVGPEGVVPRALSTLVGREDAVHAVIGMLSEHRLVTLTGTGGVGKTRVAMEVARRAAPTLRWAVWTDVAPMGSAEMLWIDLAVRLGLDGTRNETVAARLSRLVGDDDCLVVLDNCEHLLGEVAGVVVELLAACPGLRLLLTSREALMVPGEQVWRVPSLSLVSPGAPAGDGTSLSPSAELFVQRAYEVNKDLVLDAETLLTIGAICNRLDGIPLAIELAAARCRHMSPAVILGALQDRFRLLTGGERTAIARHRTMRLSMDWSYEHLDPAEQRAIRTLGVFSTSFSLDAASAVITAVHGPEVSAATEVVGRLVDKNMVAFDGDGYWLLDTVRAYALDRAEATELAAGREAHANWFAEWLAATVKRLPIDAVDAAITRVEVDVLRALEWSQPTPLRAASIVRSLSGFWYRRARIGDITTLGVATLHAVRHIDQEAWARTACHLAMAAVLAGCSPFLDDDLPDAIEVARSTGHDVSVAVGANALAYRHQSWTWAATGLAAARRVGEPLLITQSAAQLCIVGLATADPATAADAVAALASTRRLVTSTSRQAANMAPAYVDLVAGRITRSGERFAELLTHGDDADPTIELTAAIGACLAGLLGADDKLSIFGRNVIATATDAGRIQPGVLAALDWVRDRDGRRPGLEEVSKPFVALWRPVGALALVEVAAVDDALAVLAAAPQGAAPGSFLAIADAAVRTTIAHLADAGEVDRCWHEVLAGATRSEYRVQVVDALEAIAARVTGSPRLAGRVLGAADQVRLETGYRHRFRFQQDWVDQAAAAADPQGRAEASQIDWRTVVESVLRRWGERHRPTIGWHSLTPAEHRVVELVTAGLTNRQIADRLLMSTSTVKTHLAHVFTKLDVRSRAELAARAAHHGFG